MANNPALTYNIHHLIVVCCCVLGSMATAVEVHPNTGYYIQGLEHESDGEQLAVGVQVGRWRPCDIKRVAAAAIVCDDGTMISI